MKTYIREMITLGLLVMVVPILIAGNPDRQGEAGAGELLFNPWARSAGLHTMNTSSISGVEAMRLNIAGMGRVDGKELLVGNTRLYEGSTLKLNSLGFVTKVGNGGAIGVSLMAVDFGDIQITTTDQPEGVGGSYSPGFFNLGIGYAYTYANKISVGVLFRAISESLPDVSAFGFAIDAGVQYVSGEDDNFKLGISLRNVGSPMKFSGQGLSSSVDAPGSEPTYQITVDQRAQRYELPSVLNIGLSYDFYFGEQIYLRALTNFTSNAFSRDQIGGGLEFSLMEKFSLRGAYKYELDQGSDEERNIYSGLSVGASVDVPLQKSGGNRIGIDYAYRATNPFRGSHNVSLKLSF